jgi:hypothetical protein
MTGVGPISSSSAEMYSSSFHLPGSLLLSTGGSSHSFEKELPGTPSGAGKTAGNG